MYVRNNKTGLNEYVEMYISKDKLPCVYEVIAMGHVCKSHGKFSMLSLAAKKWDEVKESVDDVRITRTYQVNAGQINEGYETWTEPYNIK